MRETEYKESCFTAVETQARKVNRNQSQGKATFLVSDELQGSSLWMSLRVQNSMVTQSRRGLHNIWDLRFISRSWPGSHSKYQREKKKKTLLLLTGGGEKEAFEIHQRPLFFSTRSPLRRNYVTGPQPAGVLPEPWWPGRMEIPTSALCGHPLSPVWKIWETLVKFRVQRHRLTEDWDLIINLEPSPPLTIYTKFLNT